MFEVTTLFGKIHRAVKTIGPGFVCKPGLWGYMDNDGKFKNIASSNTQPKILKPIFSNVSGANYESNDAAVGRITVIELLFRAVVDTDGFQKRDCAGNNIVYAQGMLLTPAYKSSTASSTDLALCPPQDLGKLRPALENDIAVAVVKRFIADSNTLEYDTISSRSVEVSAVRGSGTITLNSVDADGVGDHDAVPVSPQLVISDVAPVSNSTLLSDPFISYTLSKAASSGMVIFTDTGDGIIDPDSPQTFALSGANLNSGVHVDVNTGLVLVNGAIYDISFNAVGLDDSTPAVEVVSTDVTFSDV